MNTESHLYWCWVNIRFWKKFMNDLEIYVLCKNRSKESAISFLDQFLPNRKPCAQDYHYPQYVDEPEYIYEDSDPLLEALEKDTDSSYSLYWNTINNPEIRMGMLFFTKDGFMIAGLVIGMTNVEKWFEKLADQVSGKYGYAHSEGPPPDDSKVFIKYAKNSDFTRLVDGKVIVSKSLYDNI